MSVIGLFFSFFMGLLDFQRISFDFKGFCDFLDFTVSIWNQRKSFENQVKPRKKSKISRVQTFTQQLWCLHIMPSVWDHFPRGFSGTWCWHSPGKGPPLRFIQPGDSYSNTNFIEKYCVSRLMESKKWRFYIDTVGAGMMCMTLWGTSHLWIVLNRRWH